MRTPSDGSHGEACKAVRRTRASGEAEAKQSAVKAEKIRGQRLVGRFRRSGLFNFSTFIPFTEFQLSLLRGQTKPRPGLMPDGGALWLLSSGEVIVARSGVRAGR